MKALPITALTLLSVLSLHGQTIILPQRATDVRGNASEIIESTYTKDPGSIRGSRIRKQSITFLFRDLWQESYECSEQELRLFKGKPGDLYRYLRNKGRTPYVSVYVFDR